MKQLLFLITSYSIFDVASCLTQSDGYNIGVILGSILAALIAIGTAAFLFYMCCVKNWLSPSEPKDLGYKRHDDFGTKKPKAQKQFGDKGSYNVRGASVVPKSELGGGRRQPASDRYKSEIYDSEADYDRRPTRRQDYVDDRVGMVSIVGSKPQPQPTSMRYSDSTDVGGGVVGPNAALVLSSSETGPERGRNSSNMSYSSESELRGRPLYEGSRVYHQQQQSTYSATVVQATKTTANSRGSPTALSAAYLGTGV